MSHRALAVVALLALGVRFAYIVAFMRDYSPDADANHYYALADSFAHGHGLAHPLPTGLAHATAIRPPLYPTVLGATFWVFGTHVGVAQLLNSVFGAGVAVLAAMLGARVAGSGAGIAAGVVVACYPPLIANDVTVLAESLALLLLLATFLLLVRAQSAWAGVTLGLLMLCRASAQWLVVVLAFWLLWRLGWRHALRFAVVAVVVVMPWMVRNAVRLGGPAVVTSNGFNLNALYSPEARADDGFVDGWFDDRFASIRARAADELDLDSDLRTHALKALRDDPDDVGRVLRNGVRDWFELAPSRNEDPERQDGRNLTVRRWTLPLFYVVSIVGLLTLIRMRRSATAQLLLLGAAYFTAVSLVSVAAPRLRAPVDVAGAIGTGIAIASLRDRSFAGNNDPPAARAARLGPALVACGLVVAVIGATGWLWREHEQDDADRSVDAAVARDLPVLERVARAYPVDAHAAPPMIDDGDVARVKDLATVLGDRAAADRVGDRAVLDTRAAARELDVFGLLIASEYLDGGTPSMADIERRWNAEVRRHDKSLAAWDVMVRGDTLRAAIASVRRSANR
jgi:hypothetical protein